jgi:hypothetical protein
METQHPRARREGLLVEEVDGEVLAYDLKRDIAWRLNTTAAAVWRRCDGTQSISDLAGLLGNELSVEVDENAVLMALDELVGHDMIASGYAPRDETAVEMSRRRFFRKTAVAGAATLAAPVVYSMVVPSAAAAVTYGSDRRLKRNICTLTGRR